VLFRSLSQRAAQFKAALDAAPAKVAEVRQIITQTVGEFQHLKDDFRISSAAFPEVMEQITSGAGLLNETGYSLDRVEMDMGVNSRLIVHLNRDNATSVRVLEDLKERHQDNVAMRGLLAALLKAEELAAKVDLPGMTYGELAVEVGMIPSVRLCWLSDAEYAEEEAPAVGPPPLPIASAPAAPATSAQPSAFFGQGSFFERRATPPAASGESQPAPEPAREAPAAAPTPKETPATGETPAPATPAAGDWRKDALARFKKMPDLSKYHR